MPGFVGFKMEPGIEYSITAPKSFRVSGVAIETGELAKVYFISEEERFVIATLTKHIPQASLDLKFYKGESVAFEVDGDATISLSGYIDDDDIQVNDDATAWDKITHDDDKVEKGDDDDDCRLTDKIPGNGNKSEDEESDVWYSDCNDEEVESLKE